MLLSDQQDLVDQLRAENDQLQEQLASSNYAETSVPNFYPALWKPFKADGFYSYSLVNACGIVALVQHNGTTPAWRFSCRMAGRLSYVGVVPIDAIRDDDEACFHARQLVLTKVLTWIFDPSRDRDPA
jgi:hypothetical protein